MPNLHRGYLAAIAVRSAELMKDIRTRTNLPATRCEIGDVDLMRDSAEITVYYATPARGERTLAGS